MWIKDVPCIAESMTFEMIRNFNRITHEFIDLHDMTHSVSDRLTHDLGIPYHPSAGEPATVEGERRRRWHDGGAD